MIRHARLTLLGIAVLVAPSLARAQPAEATEEEQIAAARATARELSKKLVFRADSETGTELVYRPKSLLQWSNPVSGKVYGDVFVWTRDGRPEVVASIFRWYVPHQHANVEIQSLSLGPLHGTFDGAAIWNPREPGLEFAPVTEAPRAPESKAGRLLQMRQLAKGFTAEAFDREDPNSTWNLRLLGRPILRYESPKQGIRDGAIFAFVQDTTSNPEVLLLLELRDNGDGDDGETWQYALCRQNSLRFRARYAEETVWEVPRIAPPWLNVRRPENTYMSHRVEIEE